MSKLGYRGRLRVLRELFGFLRERRSYALAPIIIILGLMALFAVIAEIPVLTPFIYALF